MSERTWIPFHPDEMRPSRAAWFAGAERRLAAQGQRAARALDRDHRAARPRFALAVLPAERVVHGLAHVLGVVDVDVQRACRTLGTRARSGPGAAGRRWTTRSAPASSQPLLELLFPRLALLVLLLQRGRLLPVLALGARLGMLLCTPHPSGAFWYIDFSIPDIDFSISHIDVSIPHFPRALPGIAFPQSDIDFSIPHIAPGDVGHRFVDLPRPSGDLGDRKIDPRAPCCPPQSPCVSSRPSSRSRITLPSSTPRRPRRPRRAPRAARRARP